MKTQHLYTYGTLQVATIIEQIVGRRLAGVPARLAGYARFRVEGHVYPAIVEAEGSELSGVLYTGLDAAEMERLDFYEGNSYERREVVVWVESTQRRAATYVLRPELRHRLSSDPWNLDDFVRDHLEAYLVLVGQTSRAP